MRNATLVDVDDTRVRYARNGGIRLAFRVYGDGDSTLVWIPVLVGSITFYDDPSHPWGAAVRELSRDLRVVVWDGRGSGLSDPVTHPPSLQQRMTDLQCVLDAANADCPTLFGPFAGGPLSIMFAATHPERVRSLILYGTAARFIQDPPEFPWGFTTEQVTAQIEDIDAHWGEGALTDVIFGTAADVPGVREQFGRFQSTLASPAMARMLWRAYLEVDVRDALGSVRAPALVMARPGDRMVQFEATAALAAALPNAQLVTLPPGDHHSYDIGDVVAAEILRFCEKPAGARAERVLATVLFTDIVGSTEQLGAAGDEHWRHQLDAHDEVVDALLVAYGGRRIKHTGDGVFAIFDGPSNAARCALAFARTGDAGNPRARGSPRRRMREARRRLEWHGRSRRRTNSRARCRGRGTYQPNRA